MATDLFSSASSPSVIAGLFVAGLGAVFAYTRMGPGHAHAGDRAETPTPTPNIDEDVRASEGSKLKSGSVARRRRKKKTKGAVVGAGAGEGDEDDEASGAVQGSGSGGGGGGGIPGGFEGTRADVDVPVVPRAASLAGTSGKNKKKKRGKGRGKDRAKTEAEADAKDAEQDDEEGSETGKEGARTTAHAPHSGDSTDASVSRLPSAPVSASAHASSRAIRAGTKPHSDRTRAASRPREIRPSPSLSLDTDSSWTHVGRKRLEASGARTLPDSVDLTSSDIASTASDSPVAERMGGTDDVRGARALEDRRTLAEKLVPRPRKSEVDDMLERPDGQTLARVMRVQEVPVPGFSWEDYGGDSLVVHDADEEDEGEWGVVKSRRHNRTQLPETATVPASSSPDSTPTMTKKQRQNARKRELAKSAKAEAEATRLEELAKHKRELERVRAVEQSRSRI